MLFQDPQEQLSEESSAFDKNETNAFRENSMVVEAIRPYLTNKSSSPSAGFGGELRPAFNLAFADSLTSKWTIFFYAENSTKVSSFWDQETCFFGGKLLELMYSLRKIDFRNLSDVIGFYQNKDILFRIRETILKMACEKYFGHEL